MCMKVFIISCARVKDELFSRLFCTGYLGVQCVRTHDELQVSSTGAYRDTIFNHTINDDVFIQMYFADAIDGNNRV